jgi:hypothetical protein
VVVGEAVSYLAAAAAECYTCQKMITDLDNQMCDQRREAGCTHECDKNYSNNSISHLIIVVIHWIITKWPDLEIPHKTTNCGSHFSELVVAKLRLQFLVIPEVAVLFSSESNRFDWGRKRKLCST